MGRKPEDLDPTISLAHYAGAEIRRRRGELGMTLQELAATLMHGPDLVRKVEAAQRFPSREFLLRCDDVLDAGGALGRLWPLLQREHLLRSARHRTAVPHGVFVAGAEDRPVLEWLIGPRTPRGRVVDDHSGAAAEILDRLRSTDRSQGAGGTYPRLVMHLRDGFDELAARAPRLAAGYLELAGYESVDLGADGHAQAHYLRALRIATDAGDRCYGSYLIGVSLAHLALHAQDAAQAERLATAAMRGADDVATPGLRAALHAVVARAWARQGDERACTRALIAAQAALARSVVAEARVDAVLRRR
jgi:transcriptional regulator with XRE-family HTH domain